MGAARQCAKDRMVWRAIVHAHEFHETIFAWSSFGPSSRVQVAYHLERGGMQLHDEIRVNYKK